MELNRELLNKFVDGELSPQETEHIAEQLVQHPEWNAYVQEQEALRHVLRTQFLELDRTVPERLVKAALGAPVSRLWLLRQALRLNLLRWVGGVGSALAAGIVIGLLAQPQKDFAVGPLGRLLAEGDLGHMLDNRLAADNPAGAATRVGLSFRNRSGQDCRTFSGGESAGMACHVNGKWVIEIIVHHKAESPRAQYRMAGSEMPDSVRQAVVAGIVGEPFDAAAEARARANGWSGR